LAALAGILYVSGLTHAAQEAPLAAASSAPAQPLASEEPAARSTVYFAHDPSAIGQWIENPTVTRPMVDQLVLAATGAADVKTAWKRLVTSKDVVGIKVSTAGGRYFSSHRGVVEAIASGLEQAGVSRAKIIVWDRHSSGLRDAGYVTRSGEYVVRGIDPPRGLDPASSFFAPAFGRLIWGDLSFKVKKTLKEKAAANEDQLSPESHLPFLLTREITKIVNVALLSDEPGCGVAGALYNVTVPNVDNGRRFTQGSGSASICDLYLDEHIGPRVVLHFIDGLVAQYAGAPQFNANYAFQHATLYASRDPVALDVTILARMEKWREQAKLPPIGKLAAWLKVGEELGIGHSAAEDIDLKRVPAKP
jgi:hypothetical protein